jgi:putative FmdB family regulatory protein
MPIYEYTCSSCEKTSDVLQKMSDPTPGSCSHCGAENTLSRMVSRTSFVLKGGGWYADLYSSAKKDGGASKSEAPAAATPAAAPAASSSSSSGGNAGGASTTSSPAAAAAPTK